MSVCSIILYISNGVARRTTETAPKEGAVAAVKAPPRTCVLLLFPLYVLTRDCGQFSNRPDERQVIAVVCPVGGRPATSYYIRIYLYYSRRRVSGA